MFRRNQIVVYEATVAWWTPGRILRRITDEEFLVLDILGRLPTVHIRNLRPAYAADLERIDDVGRVRSRYPVIRRMPSMRKLKQHAAWYHPEVWEKPKRRKNKRHG